MLRIFGNIPSTAPTSSVGLESFFSFSSPYSLLEPYHWDGDDHFCPPFREWKWPFNLVLSTKQKGSVHTLAHWWRLSKNPNVRGFSYQRCLSSIVKKNVPKMTDFKAGAAQTLRLMRLEPHQLWDNSHGAGLRPAPCSRCAGTRCGKDWYKVL